jgi:hypothetical protein
MLSRCSCGRLLAAVPIETRNRFLNAFLEVLPPEPIRFACSEALTAAVMNSSVHNFMFMISKGA